ncbi:hypothetical protein [Terasakiella sp. SH-1]|uniref:RSP_7527 family protein n=1 Tax=Terasakiella sp. SH-1 TaxID=2560057 RepID=UPI001072F52E|nr:hypothetical protein [Terasakiella sp. SH-1]
MNKEYMILEAAPITQRDIKVAMQRAHRLRSEAAWSFFGSMGAWVFKQLHLNVSDHSKLAHSS